LSSPLGINSRLHLRAAPNTTRGEYGFARIDSLYGNKRISEISDHGKPDLNPYQAGISIVPAVIWMSSSNYGPGFALR
jgi:hypothetical protein